MSSPSLLARLFPRVPHPIPVEVYRHVGKLRLIVVACAVGYNLIAATSIDYLGLDRERWFAAQALNLSFLTLSGALGLVIWRGGVTEHRLRELTFVCIGLETGSFLVNISLYGSLGSHMTLTAVLVALLYRVTFDFRIGAWALGLFIGGQVLIVGAEAEGWLPAQLAFPGLANGVYASTERVLATAPWVVMIEVFAFFGVNLMVVRMQHKDHAIRSLREALVATEAGRVGRHTGRTLRDTYLVHGLLGVGGMGEVYRGRHQRTRRPVAIKLLHSHMVDDPVQMARFRQEAEIAGSLDSEHVVEVLDADVDDGQPFIVLELLQGRSLRETVVSMGRLEPVDAAEIVTQVAAGLSAAHRASVVHRDLKPDNLFLVDTREGRRVKILDFGISKIRDSSVALTGELAIIGTPDFMSPEQAVGHTGAVDHRADIFALGAVLYFALTGNRPFHSASVPAILRKILEEDPARLSDVRPELDTIGVQLTAVLAIAMAKQIEARYSSAAELAEDFGLATQGHLPAHVLVRAAALPPGRSASIVVGDPGVSSSQTTRLRPLHESDSRAAVDGVLLRLMIMRGAREHAIDVADGARVGSGPGVEVRIPDAQIALVAFVLEHRDASWTVRARSEGVVVGGQRLAVDGRAVVSVGVTIGLTTDVRIVVQAAAMEGLRSSNTPA